MLKLRAWLVQSIRRGRCLDPRAAIVAVKVADCLFCTGELCVLFASSGSCVEVLRRHVGLSSDPRKRAIRQRCVCRACLLKFEISQHLCAVVLCASRRRHEEGTRAAASARRAFLNEGASAAARVICLMLSRRSGGCIAQFQLAL